VHVLLVEDDRMIGEAIRATLEDAGHCVDWQRNGLDAEDRLSSEHYDAVLLDLGLPGQDGIEVLREHRLAGGDTPILVMTARDGLEDRIRGLDLGADDYLVKPFDVRELLARLRAVVRRRGAGRRLASGGIELDPDTHQVWRDGEEVHLTAREFSLLEALLSRPGAILSRSQIELKLYGPDEKVESNAVDFLIHALRRKLGETAVRNVRGVGWTVERDA
jgi:DNA-binding response OmpR family regulator